MKGDVKRAAALVATVENTLGWAPYSATQRRMMAESVLAKMAEKPLLYTWANLAITVEFLRRDRVQVGTPMYLFHRLEQAVAAAHIEPPASALAVQVEAAIRHESFTQHDGWQHWVGRLTRAAGVGRQVALDDWAAAGRQS